MRFARAPLAASGRKDQGSRAREGPRHHSVHQANLTEEEPEIFMSQWQILDSDSLVVFPLPQERH